MFGIVLAIILPCFLYHFVNSSILQGFLQDVSEVLDAAQAAATIVREDMLNIA